MPTDPDLPSTPPAPDLTETVRRFVEAQRTPKTRLEYTKALSDFLHTTMISSLGGLLAVTSDDVVGYRNGLQDRGLAPATINQRLAAVRGLFRRLVVERRIQGNPAAPELVKGLAVSDESRTEGLSVDEVNGILATCDGTLRGLRDRALLMTLFYEGLRRSEASKLRFRDLTTKTGLLVVRQAKNRDYATIRLRSEAKRAVLDYLEVLCRELRQREPGPEDPVFASLSRRTFGRALSPTAVNEIVRARAKKAGISRRITAHSMRHACTTTALAAGVPLHHVQRHLRHRDIRTTLRYDRDREIRNNPTLDGLPRIG